MHRTAIAGTLVALAAVASADDVTAVYPVGFMDTAAAAETVRAVVGGDGTVVEDPGSRRLIVMAPPEVQARVRAALATILESARNVHIQVSTTYERTGHQAGAEVGVRAGSGDVGVVVGNAPRQPGVVIGAGATRTRESGSAVQQVVTLSGSRAGIRVAREVPYEEWLWSWGAGRQLWAEGGTRWHAVETSLAVEPQVLGGGRVMLRVMPRFDYELGGRRQTTDVTELAAEVVVAEGQEVEIGSLVRDDAFRQHFLVGLDDRGEQSRVRITVRASVR